MIAKLIELELTDAFPTIWGLEGCREVRGLVRHAGRLIGWVHIPVAGRPALTAEQLYEAVFEQLSATQVAALLGMKVFPMAERKVSLRPVSVVVCTRDRTALLARCLKALLALDYPDYEIVVIDNAPREESTRRLVAEMPVRYVREDRPGLNWARNRGVAEARHDLIAFTDDDARPDAQWLRAIARAFDEPGVDAVTGFVAPLELWTPAQAYFEDVYGGMSKGFQRRVFRKEQLAVSELLWARAFGVGANMAFRREIFDQVGLFDVALDAGTATQGGGDVEFFHRAVAGGRTLVYEPQALVWHLHRIDPDALKRQLYANGRSVGAYLLTCLRNRTVSRSALLRFVVRDWFMHRIARRLWRPGAHERRLVIAEALGMMSSPWAYRRARAQARALKHAESSGEVAAGNLEEPLLDTERAT